MIKKSLPGQISSTSWNLPLHAHLLESEPHSFISKKRTKELNTIELQTEDKGIGYKKLPCYSLGSRE